MVNILQIFSGDKYSVNRETVLFFFFNMSARNYMFSLLTGYMLIQYSEVSFIKI